MENGVIKVGDVEIDAGMGTPVEIEGEYPRAAIDLQVKVNRLEEFLLADRIHDMRIAFVEDPFTRRRYLASIKTEIAFADGFSPRSEVPEGYARVYNIEITEVPQPGFDELELDGERFEVDAYIEVNPEDDLEDGPTGACFLLRLTEEEFQRLGEMIDLHSRAPQMGLRARRIGLDAELRNLRFGGAMYWSQEPMDPRKPYRQVVRLWPLEYGPRRGRAGDVERHNLMREVSILRGKLEALVAELRSKGLLSSDLAEKLLDDEGKGLVDDRRKTHIRRRMEQVEDAALYL